MIKTNINNSLTASKMYPREAGLYMGTEIEIDNPSSTEYSDTRAVGQQMQQALRDSDLNCHLERDGSLGSRGIELITQPCTLSALKAHRPAFSKAFRIAQQNGFNNIHKKAGLHIHVSKRALGKSLASRLEVTKSIMRWMYANQRDLTKFARRDDNRWCQYHPTYGLTSKYYMLNAYNPHTIEFRIFTGATDVNYYFACVELVHTIVKIAKSRHRDLETMTLDEVINSNKSHKDCIDYWKSL